MGKVFMEEMLRRTFIPVFLWDTASKKKKKKHIPAHASETGVANL